MKRILVVIGSLLLSVVLAGPVWATNDNLIIMNGRAMDPEMMFDDIANLGIKDGRIATITRDKISSKETINANGLVAVSPGFIDTQFHRLTPFGIKMELRDGVITALYLENGILNTAEWYDAKADQWQVNYGATVGLGHVRMVVLNGLDIKSGLDTPTATPLLAKASADRVPGWSVTRSTLEQINQITA